MAKTGKTAEKKGGKKKAETPLMTQFYEIKKKYPDALLLFRVGDFYETFGSDAIKTADILGIVLTKRANGSAAFIELAGFPYHALDAYLPKLVRAGQRVAICEQLEDPKQTKSIVKRGVTELVTPGISYSEKVLDHKSNNFLASVYFQNNSAGVSFLDVSTGEFLAASGTHDYIEKLIQSFQPTEIIFSKKSRGIINARFGSGFYTYAVDDWMFGEDFCREKLTNHFKTKSLKGFGLHDLPEAVVAAGAILQYLSDSLQDKTDHISSLSRIEEEKYVWLDKFTIRNLEIFNASGGDGSSLSDVLDETISPMGSRMLKRWLALPLKEKKLIEERLEIVSFFYEDRDNCDKLRKVIGVIGDLERVISKVAAGRVNPRELVQLARALDAVEEIRNLCLEYNLPALAAIVDQLNPCPIIRDRIKKELMPDPPVVVQKGNVIAAGVDSQLDDLRAISHSGKDYLLGIQKRESELTGISSLKVAYNNVFGYYLEVTNAHKDKVPDTWTRKQTLVNAERYITEELKEYEEKILGAEEKIQALEIKLFQNLVTATSEYVVPIQHNALLIARLDCLTSFARLAIRNKYCKPEINESMDLEIRDGRHPVIEQLLPAGEEYVPNDVQLNDQDQQIIMITGPNMAGKSALLRQTALIVLMAQMGSFVPASAARIGLVDKIFTRVGASDNISGGESTFMVEMNETASILNNISDRSLILLDEIGRGTSTYDGISIAWSIAEYLHENGRCRPKTLFATHYHELNDMTDYFPRIKNYNVSVKEVSGKIIFMRKLVKGGSEHSFGIHVAEMAGMPPLVVKRAREVLGRLEHAHSGEELRGEEKRVGDHPEMQLSFFQLEDPLLERMREELISIEINTLTPVEALMKLDSIKKLLAAQKQSTAT